MKVRFKKKQKARNLTLLFFVGLALIPVGYESATLAGALFLVWITIVIASLYDYEISEKDRLKDYAISIDIHRIHKIVDEENSVVVHFNKKEDGSVKTHRFAPKDKVTFLTKLKEINPNIQII